MVLNGIMEWILGNTFPSVVFCSFGGFYLSFGGILHPAFAAYSSYGPPDAKSPEDGMSTQGFNASLGKNWLILPQPVWHLLTLLGFFLLAMTIPSIIYLICALRINAVFVIIFATLVPALMLLLGAFWVWAEDYDGNTALATRLCVVSWLLASFRHQFLTSL